MEVPAWLPPYSQQKKAWVIGALVVLVIGLGFYLIQLTATKTIYMVVDGEALKINTRESTVKELLTEQNVPWGSHDFVSMPINVELKHGDKVEIQHALSFKVHIDGEVQNLYSTRPDVFGALTENGIALGVFDRIEPALSEPLQPNMDIHVTRVIHHWVSTDEKIKYNVVRKADASMMKGKEKVIRPGKEGTQLVTEKRVYEDGVLISSTLLTKELKPTEPKVVAYGTKKAVRLSTQSPIIQQVTKDGVTFDVRKIIQKAELTAYGAGVEHTGKTKDHPEYAITFTGVRASEGRTVAVDPRVIPLGWWIYIDGYGFRRTEDTGSAVKGNRVDIFFEDDDFASSFGLKRDYTIYVIGPNKPF
jgi:3D (Asp-Asp-Asp) domain-containing protein